VQSPNSGSNSSLKLADDVLLYAPSDASVQSAQQLAAQLHTSFDAIVLPGGGFIAPGQAKHILVAYDASFILGTTVEHVVNIADVDLVNTSGSNQNSTAHLNVYASDMVNLTRHLCAISSIRDLSAELVVPFATRKHSAAYRRYSSARVICLAR
jgi:hypothetical protein